jgi:hypothetical protein
MRAYGDPCVLFVAFKDEGLELAGQFSPALLVTCGVALQGHMYQQAAFCYEELLLHQPSDVRLHLLYADTLYTLGGGSNLRTARSHYAAALQLSDGRQLRALYGVTACAAQLSGIKDRVKTRTVMGLAKMHRDVLGMPLSADPASCCAVPGNIDNACCVARMIAPGFALGCALVRAWTTVLSRLLASQTHCNLSACAFLGSAPGQLPRNHFEMGMRA